MATPQEKLAASLEVLRALQGRGRIAIRSRDLSRTHRERLVRNGFLQEVMKGWYIPAGSRGEAGDSTPWYATFWDFSAAYLRERFGTDWCLAPEQSLSLYAGNRTVPTVLHVRASKGGNKLTQLLYGTSLMDARYPLPDEAQIVQIDGLRLYSVPAALITCTAAFFRQTPTDVRAAMATIKDASDVLALLLAGGHSTIAGRLAGALRNTGQTRIADDILKTMTTATLQPGHRHQGLLLRSEKPLATWFKREHQRTSPAVLPKRDGLVENPREQIECCCTPAQRESTKDIRL